MVKGSGDLREAYHRNDQGEFPRRLADLPLQRKAVAARLLLRVGWDFSLRRPDENRIAVFNAENAALPPPLQLHDQNALSGHKDTHVKLPAKELTVPIDDVAVIQIRPGPGEKSVFPKITGRYTSNQFCHGPSLAFVRRRRIDGLDAYYRIASDRSRCPDNSASCAFRIFQRPPEGHKQDALRFIQDVLTLLSITHSEACSSILL